MRVSAIGGHSSLVRRLSNAFRLLWIFAILSTTAVGGTIDQVHSPEPYRYGAAIYDKSTGAVLGQTFTVGQTGLLARVEVQVYRDQLPTATLTMEIRATKTTGFPPISPGALLASVDLDPSLFPTDRFTSTFTGADLGEQSVSVEAGDVLVLLLHSQTDNYPHWYLWTTSDSLGTPSAPSYAGGARYAGYTTSGPWGIQDNLDAGFRTFVTVPEPPGSSLGVFALIAFVVCCYTTRVMHVRTRASLAE